MVIFLVEIAVYLRRQKLNIYLALNISAITGSKLNLKSQKTRVKAKKICKSNNA
jgi:hypothetical protein